MCSRRDRRVRTRYPHGPWPDGTIAGLTGSRSCRSLRRVANQTDTAGAPGALPIRIRAVLAALMLAILLAASPAAAGTAAVVQVRSLSYDPDELTVPRGTLVRWVNQTNPSRVHDVISSIPDYFVSPRFATGEEYAFRFTAAGTFTYICSIHDTMLGLVRVPLGGAVLDREGPVLRVRLATEALPDDSPFRFVVFRRDPGSPAFAWWHTTRRAWLDYRPTGPGTYEFLMRVKNRDKSPVTGPGGNSPILRLDVPA